MFKRLNLLVKIQESLCSSIARREHCGAPGKGEDAVLQAYR